MYQSLYYLDSNQRCPLHRSHSALSRTEFWFDSALFLTAFTLLQRCPGQHYVNIQQCSETPFTTVKHQLSPIPQMYRSSQSSNPLDFFTISCFVVKSEGNNGFQIIFKSMHTVRVYCWKSSSSEIWESLNFFGIHSKNI